MYQKVIVGQITGRHTRPTGVQVAKSRVGAGRKIGRTDEGQTLAATHIRAGYLLTKQLVIILRTLKHAVTHMVSMKTHFGTSTTVVACTGVVVT